MVLLFACLATDNPSDSIFHFYAEDRERYEHRINPTFSSPSGKNRVDFTSRLRIGTDISWSKNLSGKVEYQNSQDTFWTQGLNASTETSDLSLAYLSFTQSSFLGTVGRQKIELGEQRLIGPSEWFTLARSFDAARIQDGQWDAWVGKLGVANNKPETAQIGVLSHKDAHWGTTSVIAKHDVGPLANIDIQTLDHFGSMEVGKITLKGEGALQTGSNNGRDQRAWAWHVEATKDLGKATMAVEGDAASGGSNADTTRTFDNLYPTNHDQYGLADLTAWKNMNEFRVKLESTVGNGLNLKLVWQALSLRDPSDSWYSATGGANPRAGGTFTDKTGNSGRDLGKEVDFQASWDLKVSGKISAGLVFFDPGHFVQAVSGHSNMQTYGYLQYLKHF